MSKYLLLLALLFYCFSTSFSQDNNFNVYLEKESSDIPDSTNFSKSYPNPFCPVTDLKFNIKEKSHVKINLYDSRMDFIAVLFDTELEPGKYEIKWDASNLRSGTYFYELIAGNNKDTRKIILVK